MKLIRPNILLIGFFIATTLANQASAFNLTQGKLALQVGAFTAHQGTSQHVNINTLIGDDFTVTSHTDTKGFIGIGYYFNGPECKFAKHSFGINAFYLPDAGVSGNVIQENTFTNLSYSYNVSNYPIYFDAKTEFKISSDRFTPTLDVGIGPNIAQTSNFNEKSLDGGVTVPDKIYSGSSTVVFGATLGVGVKFNHVKIYRDSPLECGYRFFYLGETNLDKANSQVNTTLKTGNGYANALLCSVAI
jgi:hypothetical protein